jgi:hypothetical protein
MARLFRSSKIDFNVQPMIATVACSLNRTARPSVGVIDTAAAIAFFWFWIDVPKQT